MNNGEKNELPRILTPQDNALTFKMTTKANRPVFVIEVPGCRFNGLPICLSTGDPAEVPKCHYMKNQFRLLWNKIAAMGGI